MDGAELRELFRRVRAATRALAAPLTAEDQVVQSMPDVSPTKWHLAHTSWFFETFVLVPARPAYRPIDPRYAYLFNSYYNAVGDPYPRARRGLVSRPTVAEVIAYRDHVDREMEAFFDESSSSKRTALADIVLVGINHEEQHQELIVTDIKHVLSQSPMRPVYRTRVQAPRAGPRALTFASFSGGVLEVGHGGAGFSFDNERPRHREYLEPFELARRLVTCGEYLEFMQDGGYERPELWLSEGWQTRTTEGWDAPLYWERAGAGWTEMTLSGLRPVDPLEPVCHVSLFEADAYATWAKARLPREAEWEVAAASAAASGNFVESAAFHPLPLADLPADGSVAQLFGDVWEWTSSPYVAYPGFRPFAGELGEYNGKFMCNQIVLRGGSCATPIRHIRATYRNFFPPSARWQFSGIRLARHVT